MKKRQKTIHLRGELSKLLLITLFLMTATLLFAQEKIVSGIVIDNTGEPVIGASIVIDGTSKGTITGVDGKFTLSNVSNNATLKISYIGYETQMVPVTGKTDMKITLTEDDQTLDEVVVIGYGSVKKSSLTSAVSKMDSKGIENRVMARAETALQGQLAGVSVRSITGEPGADMQIRVRGAASVNASSDPLYVVDGVPITTLSGLNPADIESVEVLKDAASAAIYGSRGSNGVVLVTTKKGKSGKPKVSFSASYGFQQLEKKLDVLNSTEWMELYIKYSDANYLAQASNKGVMNVNIKDTNAQRLSKLGIAAGTSDAPKYTHDERWFNYVSDATKDAHTYTANTEGLSLIDWQDEFYRTAPVQDYGLTVSGGTEHTNYLFSGGYLSQEGIATGSGYDRFTFRTNIESKISKYFTAGVFLAPTYIRRDGSGLANGKDSRSHTVLSSTPVAEPGVGYMTNVEPNEKYFWAGGTSSPVYYMEKNTRRDEIVRLVGNAFFRIYPMKGMQVELSGAVNYFDYDRANYVYSSTGSNWAAGEGKNSSAGHETQRNWSTMLQALVNYDRTFGKHGINAMVGVSSEESNIGFTTDQTFNSPFPNDAIIYTFDGSKVPIGTDKVTQATPKRLVSVFGRLQYNFDERYMFSGSLRYDGGSVFGSNKKWGVFPAFSVGWLVSNEKFFKNFDWSWLNMLKVRASYGVTGNNSISNTAAYPTLSSGVYNDMPGYAVNTLGNPDLEWEKTHSTDFAVDFGFLQNRIQFSFDWYTKTTKNLLYQIPTLGASGFSSTWGNLGEIYNEGFDVEMNTKNIATADFTWSTSFNIAYNKNEVKSLGMDNTPVYSGFDGNNISNVLTVGKAVNSFYMYDAIGVWQTQKEITDYSAAHGGKPVTFDGKNIVPGDIRYKDVNNDGVYNASDKDYLGSPTPTLIYGMTNNFTYKNFDLSVLLTAQTGGKIYGVLGRAIDRPGMNPSSNAMGQWRDAWWSEENPGNGKVPYILSSTTGTTLDSRWLYSSSYLRIKNITLGYKLPINPKFISFARVYVSIENLAKWDSYYGGYSPEAANTGANGAPGGATALGLDYGGYPQPRIFTFGVNVTF